MFPSPNCDNSIESFLKRSSSFPSDHQNPSSKLDDHPLLFTFPSPFFDEHESPLNQIFLQTHQMAGNPYSSDLTNSNTDPTKKDASVMKRNTNSNKDQIPSGVVAAPLKRRGLGVVPRRRAGKKDRHSKICTAQGIRDRRMRLSLQVARKFFDLQDMLGYDKASKTIEWLFAKSKKAIKELINEHPQANNISTSDAKSESFLSECEVVSGLVFEENASNKDVKENIVSAATTMPLCINPCEKDEEKTGKAASKPNARESREKARARARCRTREKMMVKCLEGQWYETNPTNNENMQKLGSSKSPFDGVDRESNSNLQERISPYEAAYNSVEQEFADVGAIEKFLGNSSSSSTSCPISDYHCSPAVSGYTDLNSNFMGFLGNWDLMNNDRTNSIYSVANQVLLAGNPNSVYSATAQFP